MKSFTGRMWPPGRSLPTSLAFSCSAVWQEAGVEKELVSLLCKLSAQHYLPILAHHRVTSKALRHMNVADLKKVVVSICSAASASVSRCSLKHTF